MLCTHNGQQSVRLVIDLSFRGCKDKLRLDPTLDYSGFLDLA